MKYSGYDGDACIMGRLPHGGRGLKCDCHYQRGCGKPVVSRTGDVG